MSDEHFLSRWSRRKRESADDTANENAELAPAPPAQDGDESVSPADVAREAAQAPPPALPPASADFPAFDPASLPPIESITAETDIRAFLAPGVPPETARAALRRAWSADPAIRNFVGLAEYAWDFTKPDAMPGFGPLEMTDALRRYAAEILGGMKSDDAPAPQGANIAQPAQVAAPAGGSAAKEAAKEAAQAASGDTQRGPVDAAEPDNATRSSENVIADRTDTASQQETENSRSLTRRSHGGALPQ